MTANQITLARIALLPIPCAMLLFGSEAWHWVAFFLFVFLGITDFVDGFMARLEGPTKLGALLDPVADKIMIAAVTLSLSGNGWIPAWVPAAILSREFLLTMLRSSVALRQSQVKTSTLAKIKTIVQMGGFGTIFMTLFLSAYIAMWVALFWMVFFTGIWTYFVLWKKEKAPYWALPVAGAFLYWLLLVSLTSTKIAVLCQCIVIVGMTWVSALDYFKTSYVLFKISGLDRHDAVRLSWAVSHGVFVLLAASYYSELIIPALISIAFELGLGGVDNIAIAEGKILSWKLFAITTVMACWFSLVRTPGMALLLALSGAVCCWLGAREVKWRFFPAP